MKKDLNDTAASPPLPAPLPRLLAHIESQQIQWLWYHRIPLACLTILEGAAGIGTSLFASTIAAAVSAGLPLPEQVSTSKSTVILVTPHFSDASTIRPRLEAAGGDSSNVIFLRTRPDLHTAISAANDRALILPDDINILRDTIIACHAKLAIIDPITCFLPRSRGHSIQEILLRLSQVAETGGCAILLVRHLKAQGLSTTQNTDAGLPGLIASAASVLRLVRSTNNQLKLYCTKHTHAPTPDSLSFKIQLSPGGIPLCNYRDEDALDYELTADQISAGRQAIFQQLSKSSKPLSPFNIAADTGNSYYAIRHLLSRMAASGEITRVARGLYTLNQQETLIEEQPVQNPGTTGTTGTN
jgi:hypothetical protein